MSRNVLRRWSTYSLRALLAVTLGHIGAAVLHAQTHMSHPSQLAVVVDGATRPDLIPTDLAYRHFLMSIAEHRTLSTEEFERRESRLRPLRLSTADHDALLQVIAGVREQLDEVEKLRKEAETRTDLAESARFSTLDGLRQQARSLLDSTSTTIRTSLGSDGTKKLDDYIETAVKTHIKIYGDPSEAQLR